MKRQLNKTIYMFLVAGIAAMAITGFTKPKAKGQAGIVWNETTHDFGNFVMGPDAVAVFTFKNKTKKLMTLKSVEPGCSCTIADFTAEPIKNNGKGKVTAKYATKNKGGFFKKFIKVTFTDETTFDLVITGNVTIP